MLIAIDLDGTLLSLDGSISEENRLALLEAQSKGHVIAISSGRAVHDIKRIMERHQIECPIIAGNGSIVVYEGDMIFKKIMPAETAAGLLAMLKAKNYYFELLTMAGITIEHGGQAQLKAELKSLQERLGDNLPFSLEWAARELELQREQHGIHYVDDFSMVDLSSPEIYKIFVYSFDRHKISELREVLKGREDLSMTTSGWTKVEIAHPESNKGRALEVLASYMDIPLTDTVAIGDNLNDLSMFHCASVGIAMGNADEVLKRHSTHTTLPCHEHGVAYAIKKWVLGEAQPMGTVHR